MLMAMRFTKRVVGDLAAAEAFYAAMGLKVVGRNQGGEEDVHQSQVWLSASGDMDTHVLILSHFVELPPPSRPTYPGEAWLTFSDVDVDAICALCEAHGGSIYRAGEDRPEHGVRAAVIVDPEGLYIELVGPMQGSQ
jgi:catechol 2,3-dioxygenase-like lactoylglutathione lyase family enzyme